MMQEANEEETSEGEQDGAGCPVVRTAETKPIVELRN